MRFRRRKREEDPASVAAILDAEANLREIKDRSSEVSAVAKETRQLRSRNHFGEQLTEMMTPKPKPRKKRA